MDRVAPWGQPALVMGGRTPEELEMLLEDASVLRDTDALGRLFVEGALLVRGDSSARGLDAVVRLIPSTWEAGHTHLTGEGRVLQARDLALAVGRDRISVMRRGRDHRWRYAIVLEWAQEDVRRRGPGAPERRGEGCSMARSEAKAVIDRFYAALNGHDAEAAGRVVSADIEIEAPGGLLERGRDALTRLLQTYLAAFPDLEWRIVGQAVAGETVVTESVPEGTHGGPFRTPTGEIPPTGKRVASRVCDVSRVRNGEIVSLHLYWDNLEFMQALGALGA